MGGVGGDDGEGCVTRMETGHGPIEDGFTNFKAIGAKVRSNCAAQLKYISLKNVSLNKSYRA